MTEYDNTNRGALFINERKRNERSPDYTGRIDIDGTEYWLSGWKQKSRAGKTFLSLSLGDKVEARSTSQRTDYDDDDEIAF